MVARATAAVLHPTSWCADNSPFFCGLGRVWKLQLNCDACAQRKFYVMAAVPNINPTQNIVLPEHFKVFEKGTTFKCEEDEVKQRIISILGPYGVKKLSLGSGARSNQIESKSFHTKDGSGFVAAVKRKPGRWMILNEAVAV